MKMTHDTVVEQSWTITVRLPAEDPRSLLNFGTVCTEVYESLGMCTRGLCGSYDLDKLIAKFSFRSADGVHYHEDLYNDLVWAAIQRVEEQTKKPREEA